MKIAKPSARDLDAALDLMALLMAIDQGYYPGESDDEDAPFFFDDEDHEHLKLLHSKIKACLEKGPGFPCRVIGGMHTIMCNDIVDPNDDSLSLHPRIVEAINKMDACNDFASTAIAKVEALEIGEDSWMSEEIAFNECKKRVLAILRGDA